MSLQELSRGEEQQEASAQEGGASQKDTSESDSTAKAQSNQWQDGGADAASTEAVDGSAEEEDRGREKVEGGESEAVAGVSQQAGDDAGVYDQWNDEVSRQS